MAYTLHYNTNLIDCAPSFRADHHTQSSSVVINTSVSNHNEKTPSQPQIDKIPSQPQIDKIPSQPRSAGFYPAGAPQPPETTVRKPQHMKFAPRRTNSQRRKERKEQEAAEEAAKIEYARKAEIERLACSGMNHPDYRTYPLVVTEHHYAHGIENLSDAKNLMFDLHRLGSKHRATNFKIVETADCEFIVSFSITLPPNKETISLPWLKDTIYNHWKRWEIITVWQIKQPDLM